MEQTTGVRTSQPSRIVVTSIITNVPSRSPPEPVLPPPYSESADPPPPYELIDPGPGVISLPAS